MKRIWVSAGALGVLVLFCIFGVIRVNHICVKANENLRRAETAVYLGDYEGAKTCVEGARQIWKGHAGFLGIMLRHTEMDDIDLMFPGLLEALRQKDGREFYLRNGELIEALRNLTQMERPRYYNVL